MAHLGDAGSELIHISSVEPRVPSTVIGTQIANELVIQLIVFFKMDQLVK